LGSRQLLSHPKVRFSVGKSLPLVPILRQINPIHIIPSQISNINFDLCLGLHSDLLPSDFVINTLYAFSFSPCVLHAPKISSFSTLSVQLCLARGTSYETPRYAVFPTLLSLHPSSVQIFFSVPCSQTPSIYIPPLMSETKYHTHTEPHVVVYQYR
jgi:hypothetical protein